MHLQEQPIARWLFLLLPLPTGPLLAAGKLRPRNTANNVRVLLAPAFVRIQHTTWRQIVNGSRPARTHLSPTVV